MKNSPSQNWIRVRQELYRQVYSHVQLILGESPRGMAKYEESYANEFKKAWKPSNKEQLMREVNDAQIILIGDFHALHQSQRAHLRILKSLKDVKNLCLGIECIEAKHQKALDSFVQGKLSEKDFLKTVEWKKTWGFPWEHYRPLFRWVQKHKIKVYGLNIHTQRRDAKALKKRDIFAAKRIAEISQKWADRKIFVVYGDLHLADSHLPAAIRKTSLRSAQQLTIFQNSERIYFQMLKKELEDSVDVVRLAKNKFCLQNVPPWVKWQNYLLFLEEHIDLEIDEEESFDLTDVVAKYIKVICQDLSLEEKLDHFSISSAQDRFFWGEIKDKLSPSELRFAKSWVENGKSFYLPQLSLGFLARSSVNNVSQLAMSIVFSDLNSFARLPSDMPRDFLRLIWLEAIQYFGSKLVNPKRKTDTMVDIKNHLSVAHPDDQGLAAMKLALSQKLFELMHLSGMPAPRELPKPRKMRAYQDAAKILGGIMGEKIYLGYRQKMISRNSLIQLFKKPIEGEVFQDFYWEILELVESFPEPFKSKTEKV